MGFLVSIIFAFVCFIWGGHFVSGQVEEACLKSEAFIIKDAKYTCEYQGDVEV